MLSTISAVCLLALGVGAPQDAQLPITGRADGRLAPLDDLMTEFIKEHKVVGAVLAVSRFGRLVYSRGFGYADLEAKEIMQPDASFRIASLSKPITSAAVVLLAQEELFDLDDPVLEHLDSKLLGGALPHDKRWGDVTIRMLLQHTGGFDRLRTEDPMFRSRRLSRVLGVSTPPTATQIIEYMFERPLDFTPGERHAYSNFGYTVLGRTIEHVSEEGYEDVVRERILEPLGIKSMRLGRSLESDRFEDEVHYHDDDENYSVFAPHRRLLVSTPYGSWYQESLDSHAGWISSAPDLLRFALLFDDRGEEALLNKESIDATFARPEIGGLDESPQSSWYALGWRVRPIGSTRLNAWHLGYLPGSESILVRRQDGLCWAVLFNSRSGDKRLAPAIDPLLHLAMDEIRYWPEDDLFDPEPAPEKESD